MDEQKGDMVGMDHSQHKMDSDNKMQGMDHSQHQMDSKQAPMQMQPLAMEKRISGTGMIREIIVSQGKLKMSHDPIPELKWPEMTMFFNVNPVVKLDEFKPNDKVEFDLQKSDTGYVIKAMRKLTN